MTNEEILLQSERETLLREARTLAENPNATKADLKRADVLLAQASSLKTRYERQVRLADAMGVSVEELTKGIVTEEQRKAAEDREAFMRYMKTGELRTYTPMADGVEGAFIVPQTFYKTLLTGIAQYTELMDEKNVNLIASEKGNVMKLPQVDLSTITSAIVADNVDAPPVANPIFSSLLLSGFNYRTNPIAVQLNLEQDSFESVMSILTAAFSVGLARGIGADLVNGAGAGAAPQGILTAAANSGVTSAVNTNFNVGEIEQIYFSVNRAYRVSPKCAWLMNDATYKQVRSLVDSSGRLLLNIVDDEERLFGKRILISPDMPTAPGSKAILFGDFGQYQVRVVRNGATVLRKSEAPGYVERFASLYIGFLRVDAALNAPNGAKSVVYGTLHA